MKQEMISMSIKMLSMSFGVVKAHLCGLPATCGGVMSKSESGIPPAKYLEPPPAAAEKRPQAALVVAVTHVYLTKRPADVDI
ncbi:MAG: hypothetical protein V4488_18255 [Pseudomonadota bacterium]